MLREGWSESKEIKVTRDVINVPVITTEMRPDGIYVIELATFTSNSPELFRGALRQFVESGSTKLILDLRGNPGGYLGAAVDMASWFLPSGKVVVTEDYAGHATALKITVARWVGPDGVAIPREGIKPDVEVKITDEEAKADKDPQMDKAVEILKGE